MTRPPSRARCRLLGDDRPADLTRAFESAGIQCEMAERIATEIFDAIHEKSTDLQNWTLSDIENWTPGLSDVAPRFRWGGLSR